MSLSCFLLTKINNIPVVRRQMLIEPSSILVERSMKGKLGAERQSIDDWHAWEIKREGREGKGHREEDNALSNEGSSLHFCFTGLTELRNKETHEKRRLNGTRWKIMKSWIQEHVKIGTKFKKITTFILHLLYIMSDFSTKMITFL